MVRDELNVDFDCSTQDFGELEDHDVSEVQSQATELGIRMFKLITPGGETYEGFAKKGLQFFEVS